mgnify:FL=1|jgi:hypothetical protein
MSAFKILSVVESEELWGNDLGHGLGKYPWRQLKVGESFFIPRNQLPREDYRPTPSANIRKEGYRFKSKKVISGTRIGVQIKRIL